MRAWGGNDDRPLTSARRVWHLTILLTAAAAIAALVGVQVGRPSPDRPRWLYGLSGRLCVAVAATAAAQHRGLMGRDAPDPMAFTWTRPVQVGFWMANTPAPLTVVWSDGSHVIGATPMQPDTTTVHNSPGPVALAVEYPSSWPTPHAGQPLALGGPCSFSPVSQLGEGG